MILHIALPSSLPNFDKEEGNAMCKIIPWGADAGLLAAWEEGRTGYPFIDALMRQLKQTGWMHHLGRHAVAGFSPFSAPYFRVYAPEPGPKSSLNAEQTGEFV